MEKEGQGQQQQLAGADHAEISVSHARKYLQDLTEIGPRVTGSNANEYVTPKWLLDRLHAVKTNIISPDIHLDIVLQTPSSSFYIDFLGGMNNVYSNVTNVIARLSSKNIPSTSSSILVNAHFDSVPGSPGAADDGVGIAIMLELIRVLSTTPAGSNSPPLLDKPVIFLFNGAEEWVHHGAHGFISQHEWAKDVEYLINLEAIGSGGRELVFQCNSGYIAGLYGDAAPYPQASVLAHELFKHLLYKVASTDWKTFIEYGHQLYGKHVRGVDTAYVDNGYVYHTTFDSIDMIPDGTLINTGENILHLIKAMAKYAPSSPRSPVDGTSLDDQENAKDRRKFTGEKLRKVDEVMKKDEQAVFFDLFHLFLVHYSGNSITFYHSLVVILAILTTCYMIQVHHQRSKDLFYAVYIEGITVFYTYLCGNVVGILAYAFFPMRWYDGGVGIALLIFLPSVSFFAIYLRAEYSISYLKQNKLLKQLAVLVLWMVFIIPCIYLQVMTAYLGCLWIAAIVVSVWVYHFAERSTWVSALSSSNSKISSVGPNRQELADHLYILSLFPIILIWCKVIHATLVMVVPLFGKTGTVVPTDIALGGMIAIHLGLPLGSFLSNHLHQRLHKSTIRSGIMVLLAIYLWLMLGRSSYSVHHPKRLWIQRVERYYRHVDPDLPGHKWRYLPPHIRKQLQAPSKSNSDFEVVSDEGVWLSGFDERGIDLLMPYIYHYYDGTAAGTSTPIFGLLGESLAYLQSMHRTYLSPNPLDLERNMDCSMWNGDCFFSFPWYFPVPDALRHGVYLPLHSAPRHAEGKHLDFARVPLDNKLKVITRSHSLNKDEINNLVVVNGGLKQQLESCTLDQNAVYRLIEIDIFGPSHVNLAIRDEENGERVTAWWLDDLVFRPISGVEDRANVLDHLSCSAARRNEGLHYFHIASGRCDPSTKDNQPYLCTHRRLFFLVRGTEPVELVVYGHYVDLVDDNQVVGLINSLPPWSRGSEWTKFPSVLLSDLV
eukprot:gene2490-2729_t